MDVGILRPRVYTLSDCLVPKLEAPIESDPIGGEILAVLEPPPKIYAVKNFILRSADGKWKGEAENLIDANKMARLLKEPIVVYKRDGEQEIEMSFSGPGGWTGSMRRSRREPIKRE